jgi:putative ABC transport system ATP-binding protein
VSVETNSAKNGTAGAAALLAHFTRDNPNLELNASRRVLAEVVRAWPGEPRRLWWKWFSEAADSLSLHTKTVDGSVEEILSLAHDHARIVCFRDDPAMASGGEWIAIVESGQRRFHIITAGDEVVTRKLTAGALRNSLEKFVVDGQVRTVVVAPDESRMSSASTEDGHQLRPSERLWRLLRPEAPDIGLVVIFAFVVSLLMLATPLAVETLVNTVAFGRFLQPIVILALVLFTFLGFQAAINALQIWVVEIVQRRLFARIAGDLAFRMPRTEKRAVDGQYMPELANRFFDVVNVQKISANLLLDGFALVLGALVGMVVLAFYHPWLLGFDVFLVIAILVVIFLAGRGAVKSAIYESKQKYSMAGWLQDIARCPTAFRTSGGADFALERADHLIQGYLNARRSHFRIVMRQVLFALALQAIASTVLLGLGGWLVVTGELTLGQLVAAELIVTIIVGSFAKLGKHMESFYDLLASVDKLGVLFDTKTERQDGIVTVREAVPASVELNHVSFRWPDRSVGIAAVDVRIEAGGSLAILGGAGSGKSTLADLICGLREPSAGKLVIDGLSPRELRPDILQSRVSLVRGNEIFHATVEENVHLHREGITSMDVRDTLEEVGLLEPVLRLDHGVHATLASQGEPLSEGQCRLLGIARAAIGSPGLLVVDGTLDCLGGSDLDRCLDFLLRPDRPWTLVVATSRKDIATRLDRILTLDYPDLPVLSHSGARGN